MTPLSQSGVSQREGFRRVGAHRDGCLSIARGDGEPFVITDRHEPFDFSLRSDGRKGGSTMWWRFVCNDPCCPAVLLVRWDQIMHFVNQTEADRA